MAPPRIVINRFRSRPAVWTETEEAPFRDQRISAVHTSLPEYDHTPLVALPRLASDLGLGGILVKDESHRFGLKAFKALGASYAVFRWLCETQPEPFAAIAAERFYHDAPSLLPPGSFTLTTATDGNHGRGVAWIARKLRQRAVIYMPQGSAEARVEAIRAEGAEVVIVDGTYDDAVARCAHEAEQHGWQIISDTSWPGYDRIPRWIQAGYVTMFREIDDALEGRSVDAVLIPGGVGALAAAAAWYCNRADGAPRPWLISVEPTEAACLQESANSLDGLPRLAQGRLNSVMAGLNCGLPSAVAWPFIKTGFDAFVSVTDSRCREAMWRYYYPVDDDPRIIAGESGAATLAGLLELVARSSDHSPLLDQHDETTVLLLNTEGDTDPEGFSATVGI